MKNYENLKRLSNAVLTFCNRDRLSGNESNAVLDLLDMQKSIISECIHEPKETFEEIGVNEDE